MNKLKRKYTEEYKEEAVRLAESMGSIAGAARQLGIGASLLHGWKEKLREKSSASQSQESFENANLEIRRLKKENEQLKKINVILKTAAAFFSQDHLK